MGLNESFSQVRTQLLLMEPEPTITRAFSLVVQKVEQRVSTETVKASPVSAKATTLLAKTSNVTNSSVKNQPVSAKKKECPILTHCNIQGHTIDRCYKFHGYPPDYRNQKTPSVQSNVKPDNPASPNLTLEQCPNLLAILQSHLYVAKNDTSSPSSSNNTTNVAGTCSTLIPASNNWVIDYRAFTHICYSKGLFSSLMPISEYSVTLQIRTGYLPTLSMLAVKFNFLLCLS